MSLFPKYTPAKPAKVAKLDPALAGLATLAASPTVLPLPQWQHDLCVTHGDFMGSTGNCLSAYCFCDAINDSGDDLEKLRPYEIGHGITCGGVLDCCQGTKDEADLKKHPAFFVLIAESEMKKVAQHDSAETV
jgi:hypothetical protein